MSSPASKIFVTGGTGFIGSYLLRYLIREGYSQVFALKRKSSRMTLVADILEKVTWIEGDLLDIPVLESALSGMDYVYHCAGKIAFDSKDAARMMRVNEEGTANIVNLCLTFGVKKLVHVSSIAALGRSKDGRLIDENTHWERSNLNTKYAISKYAGEMQVWRGMAEGLNAVIVNPSLVIGSGFWMEGTAMIFKTIDKGIPFYPAGANGVVDVRDVARWMIALMNADIQGERFILSAENLTQKQLMSRIATILGKKPPFLKITPVLRELAVWFFSIIHLFSKGPTLITRDNLMASSKVSQYDNAKSRRFIPLSYTPIRDTLEATGGQYLQSKKQNLEALALPLN